MKLHGLAKIQFVKSPFISLASNAYINYNKIRYKHAFQKKKSNPFKLDRTEEHF